MSKLLDLNSQIEKLQKQAAEIRDKEFNSTVTEIQKLMKAYGITIKDLQAPKAKVKVGRTTKVAADKQANAKKERKAVAAKYKGPNGETWSGRGLKPKWLNLLVDAGQPKEFFLIATASEAKA